ncbi:MAG: prepilin peptidase [Alphaproteobacteria bacterium]|nr:prepilin peptidase [Alphaproteobacteria bacterium]
MLITLSFAAFAIYVLALAAAAVSDLVRYEIPNGLSLALVAAFALMAPTLPIPVTVNHVLAGTAVFGLTLLLFALGVCGGGDVKLLGATALWMGWSNLPSFLLAMTLIGAVLALCLMMTRWFAGSGLVAATGVRPRRLFVKDNRVPYGVAIAIAGVLMLPRMGAAALIATSLN